MLKTFPWYFAETGSLLKSLTHRIQCMTDCTDPIILGFSPDMAGKLIKLKSQTLNILQHQSQIIYTDIREDSRILMQSQELPEYKQAWERLLTLQDKLRQKIMDIGVDMGSAYLSHLSQFLQTEWQFLYKLVSFVLCDNFQPAKYNVTNSTPVNVTSAALSRLEGRADLLGSYSWEESSRPHAYQLSAFLNPQGFLVALIRDVASIQKKDISVLSLHFKVNQTFSNSPAMKQIDCTCKIFLLFLSLRCLKIHHRHPLHPKMVYAFVDCSCKGRFGIRDLEFLKTLSPPNLPISHPSGFGLKRG